MLVVIASSAAGAEVDGILEGIGSIAAPGVPGTVSVIGEQAFVVVDAGLGRGIRQPVIASARVEKGRVVVFGHDGYFHADALAQADTTPLLLHLIKWAAADKPKPRIGAINLAQLAQVLKARELDVTLVDPAKALARLSDFDIVFLAPAMPRDDGDVAALKRFVEAGGAIFVAHTGWGWLQTHPGKTLAQDYPLNRLLAPMGLVLSDGMIEKDRKDQLLHVSKPAEMMHASAALDLILKPGENAPLLRDRKEDLAQAAQTLVFASRAAPVDTALMQRLAKAASEHAQGAIPSAEKPLRQTDALGRVILTMQLGQLARAPVEQTKAHPAAAAFPGAVPGVAKRVTEVLDVDTSIPRWHSTGLYAAPGEIVTVTISKSAAAKGLGVRIGAHTDHTYHLAAWHRAPEISRWFKLDQPTTPAANAFGGMIYIDVPSGAGGEVVQVTIVNAVPAPLFVLGKTTPKQWRDSVRARPAPWAELATGKLIITLKSEAIRDLDDPTAVLEHWNRVMDAAATLAGWPLERKSPERMVSDADISAGYMHSGYPIMTGLDVTKNFVDLTKLRTVERGWGFYHEIGHNHQSPDWTFAGTTEVTVNLFTMYVLETVCGVTKEQSTRRALVEPAARIKKYLAKPDFEEWKADPFLALAMYAQLRNQFGWEPFKKVIAEYRSLAAKDRPKNDEQKRDQWMVRMSRATGRNLGPFFEAWGVPTSLEARQSVAGLPGWMPEGISGGR